MLIAVDAAKRAVLAYRDEKERRSPADSSSGYLAAKYEEMLAMRGHESFADTILELRKFVLLHGLPEDVPFGGDSLRARLWKLFLGAPLSLDVEEYQHKIEDLSYDSKIKEDAFRTFKKSEDFWSRINEATLLRVLHAASTDHGYVQGMNVLLGPFLLVMPELDSYYCFHSLISRHIPRYVSKNLEGVHTGSVLTSKLLAVLDPALHKHILLKLHDVSVFSVRFILTLLANVKPLGQVTRLWDATFAFGAHFNLLVFVSYLMLLRDKLLAEASSYGVSCVIQQGTLDSDLLVKVALSLVPFVPKDLFAELLVHCA